MAFALRPVALVRIPAGPGVDPDYLKTVGPGPGVLALTLGSRADAVSVGFPVLPTATESASIVEVEPSARHSEWDENKNSRNVAVRFFSSFSFIKPFFSQPSSIATMKLGRINHSGDVGWYFCMGCESMNEEAGLVHHYRSRTRWNRRLPPARRRCAEQRERAHTETARASAQLRETLSIITRHRRGHAHLSILQ